MKAKERVNIVMSPRLLRLATEAAKKEGISRSFWLQRACEEYMMVKDKMTEALTQQSQCLGAEGKYEAGQTLNAPEPVDRIYSRMRNRIVHLERAGNQLAIMAQTSGGTAGRDDKLIDAIDMWLKAVNTPLGNESEF